VTIVDYAFLFFVFVFFFFFGTNNYSQFVLIAEQTNPKDLDCEHSDLGDGVRFTPHQIRALSTIVPTDDEVCRATLSGAIFLLFLLFIVYLTKNQYE
jgi:hypothetical protein